jgi:hypothetical protein
MPRRSIPQSKSGIILKAPPRTVCCVIRVIFAATYPTIPAGSAAHKPYDARSSSPLISRLHHGLRLMAYAKRNNRGGVEFQYFGQHSGSYFGQVAIVTKRFVIGAGFFQAGPLGDVSPTAITPMVMEGTSLATGHCTR